MTKLKILIADDDSDLMAACLKAFLKETEDFEIHPVSTPQACEEAIAGTHYDVILLDISFTPNGKEGFVLLPKVRMLSPEAEIIMLTSFDDKATVSQCMSDGADDFISKNHSATEQIAERVKMALLRKGRRESTLKAGEAIAQKVGASFSSEAMKKVFALAAEVRDSARTHVLITGPSGSGKELVAKAVSRQTEKAPFYAINCACLQDDLIESELFGHERGAFTGADRLQIGKFEVANGGDLFLDEVARLSLNAQAKLLRVLQSGEFFRLGSNRLQNTTARVIAATNENLNDMVEKGQFREDLLQRLQRFRIEIPSLRKRKEDIEPIVKAILKANGASNVILSTELSSLFKAYSWPRNVRELEDLIHGMLLSAQSNELTIGDLPRSFFKDLAGESDKVFNEQNDNSFAFRMDFGMSLDTAEAAFTKNFISATASRLKTPITMKKLADELMVPKTTLIRKIHALNIAFDAGTRASKQPAL